MELRARYRLGECFKGSTFGLAPGLLQTNISIMPSKHADDFASFCRLNSAPCPLVFRSAPGQTNAPPLEKCESDIRSDLSTYLEYMYGNPRKEPVPTLINHPWQDMVTFHLGCSFSFDSKLVEEGLQVKLSMFTTKIRCVPCGSFDCNMVVSMRNIPRSHLQRAVALSINMDFAHGAPIHIGNPADILGYSYGDGRILKSDLGWDGVVGEDEVPCFWACGVTGIRAMRSAYLPGLSFSHYPASMFVTDLKSDECSRVFGTKTYPEPAVVCLNESSEKYAILSSATLDQLKATEREISGILPSENSEILARICLAISMARRGKIGLYVPNLEKSFLSTMLVARALQGLWMTGDKYDSREVCIVINDCDASHPFIKHVGMCKSAGLLHNNMDFVSISEALAAVQQQPPDPDELFSQFIVFSTEIGPDRVGCIDGKLSELLHLDPTITSIQLDTAGYNSQVADELLFHPTYSLTCSEPGLWEAAISTGLFLLCSCSVQERYRRRGLGLPSAPELHSFVVLGKTLEWVETWLSEKQLDRVDMLDRYSAFLLTSVDLLQSF